MKNLELVEMVLNFKEEKYNKYMEDCKKLGASSLQAVISLQVYFSIIELNTRISNKLEEEF